MLAQRFLTHPCDVGWVAEFAQARFEFEVKGLGSKRLDCARRFNGCAQHADHFRALPDGRVGKAEPGFLAMTIPVHGDQQVLEPARFPGHGALNKRLDLRPDVVPDLLKGLAERFGVPLPKNGCIGFVIKENEIRTPGDEHGLLGRHHGSGIAAKKFRPVRLVHQTAPPRLLRHYKFMHYGILLGTNAWG
jgi:hypothetical protein